MLKKMTLTASALFFVFLSIYWCLPADQNRSPTSVEDVVPTSLLSAEVSPKEAWDFIKKTQYDLKELPYTDVRWYEFGSKLFNWDKLTKDSKRTIKEENHFIPYQRKLIFPNGICMRGMWQINEHSRNYTGYFKPRSKGVVIARASAPTGNIFHKQRRTLAISGKIFPTMDYEEDRSLPAANFMGMNDNKGVEEQYYSEAPLANAPPSKESKAKNLELINLAHVGYKISKAFEATGMRRDIIQNYQIAQLNETYGSALSFPTWMVIKARKEYENLSYSSNTQDFREEIIKLIDAKTHLIFDLYVADELMDENNPDYHKIGSLTFTDYIASRECDESLHFQHVPVLSHYEVPEIEQDFYENFTLPTVNQIRIPYSEIKIAPNYQFSNTAKDFERTIFKNGTQLSDIINSGVKEFTIGRGAAKFSKNLTADGRLLTKMSLHRDRLLDNNLFNTGIKANSQRNCSLNLFKYNFPRRTAEGTCYFSDNKRGRNLNKFNKEDRKFRNKEFIGSKGARLSRNTLMSRSSIEEAHQNIMTPNPRKVSVEIFSRKDGKMIPAKVLNVLSAAWLQAQNHDWFSHGKNANPKVHNMSFLNVPAVKGDEAFPKGLQIPRTRPDSSNINRTSFQSTFTNEVTHWWDASHIYGSDQKTINKVRINPETGKKYDHGLIAVDESNKRLYVDSRGIPITGFTDNWWVGLNIIHTTFALEHNKIARALKKKYGDQLKKTYNKEKQGDVIFEKARLINAALIAKIHTLEWTTSLLYNKALHVGMNGNWYGIRKSYDLSLPYIRKQLKFFKVMGSHALSGLVGPGTLSLYGVPFSITEEFTSIYRMHTMIPDHLYKVNDQGQNVSNIPMLKTRNAMAGKLLNTSTDMTQNILYSMGVNNAGAITLNNYPNFMMNMKVPRNTKGMPELKFDMGTVDILRDRERLVPRYNDFRRKFYLSPITDFSDLFINKEDPRIRSLQELYNDDVEQLDLLIGTLAEETPERRYPGFSFGNTAFYMFSLMASRRLMADPFYSDYYTKDVYTEMGLCWIEKATMKSVLTRHFPELRGALESVKNAFRPWKRVELSKIPVDESLTQEDCL